MKRVKELKKLSRDHHRALVFAKRAKKARENGTVPEVWLEIEKYYDSELEAHFRAEELHIVPNLLKLGKHDLVNQLKIEHAEIRDHFNTTSPRTPDALLTFGQLLEQHVRFEERELFNVVQDIFEPEDLAFIDQFCS